jgi:hypothetical protein
VGYNKETRQVRIVFRPDRNAHAAEYIYEEVTPDIWERVRRTASTGKFINRVLNGYPYSRIT